VNLQESSATCQEAEEVSAFFSIPIRKSKDLGSGFGSGGGSAGNIGNLIGGLVGGGGDRGKYAGGGGNISSNLLSGGV
jgi:hypothetical protein